MPEDSTLKERLVTGFERDGRRRRFDPQVKRELVQACLRPGVSVARIALEHGLNANLLRRWISQYESQTCSDDVVRDGAQQTEPAFVPVVAPDISRRNAAVVGCEPREMLAPVQAMATSRLVAELPNGVVLRLECDSHDSALVTAMVDTLGRSHVSLRR
ncbi:transposase IS3/IS911 family protein [Caballeronia calidae]|uniref:Transposase IS3/IS911 family protein n=1 Tax=Caballeronia calidae TaxID=1777139 RepID=A0A158EJN8_9BURK|nr:transposase [Caballeronia calidae]SAL07065.1 transposase IS3/IS911 family protein [Caballeronia calidae]